MADTTFTNFSTIITADWLNEANTLVHSGANYDGTFHNVKAYGAVGNGVTNDAAAIQAAIDAVNALGGGTILFPEGTYAISTTVNIRSNIRLLGMGMGVSTIYALPALGTTNPMMKNISGDTGLNVRTDKNISFAHLTFDGNGRTFAAYDQNTNPPTYGGVSQALSRGHLIRMYSVENFHSHFCEYKNHRSNAPLVDAGGLNNVVLGNYFHDNGKIDDVSPCLFISPSFPNSTPNVNHSVIGNKFYNCDRMGVRFQTQGGTLTGNTFEDLGEGGIHLESGGYTVVTGNTFRNMRVTDIVCNAIEIEASAPSTEGRMVISNNVFENIAMRGIALNGALDTIVTGNVFKNIGSATVYPTPNGPLNYAAGRAAGDPIAATSRCAIQLITADTYQCKNVVITNNIITDSTSVMQYGIVFAATGTPTLKHDNILIKDNIIDGAVISDYYNSATLDEMGTNVIVEGLVDDTGRNLALDLSLNDGYSVAGSPSLTTTGANLARVIAFDAAATESWQWTLTPPLNSPVDRQILGLKIFGQKSLSTGGGNIVIELATELRPTVTSGIGGGTIDTQNFTKAVNATGNAFIEEHELIFTTPVKWTSGDFMLFRISRMGADAADTWGSDYFLIAAQIIYK